jgi:hypothetical protein
VRIFPTGTVSTVDLHWLLYSTRSKRVNIPQGCSSQPTDVDDKRSEYQYVTGGRNVSMLLEGGMSICYWKAELQLQEGGISTCYFRAEYKCYWRAEYQCVTVRRNVNVLLAGGISMYYCKAECQRVTGGRNINTLL